MALYREAVRAGGSEHKDAHIWYSNICTNLDKLGRTAEAITACQVVIKLASTNEQGQAKVIKYEKKLNQLLAQLATFGLAQKGCSDPATRRGKTRATESDSTRTHCEQPRKGAQASAEMIAQQKQIADSIARLEREKRAEEAGAEPDDVFEEGDKIRCLGCGTESRGRCAMLICPICRHESHAKDRRESVACMKPGGLQEEEEEEEKEDNYCKCRSCRRRLASHIAAVAASETREVKMIAQSRARMERERKAEAKAEARRQARMQEIAESKQKRSNAKAARQLAARQKQANSASGPVITTDIFGHFVVNKRAMQAAAAGGVEPEGESNSEPIVEAVVAKRVGVCPESICTSGDRPVLAGRERIELYCSEDCAVACHKSCARRHFGGLSAAQLCGAPGCAEGTSGSCPTPDCSGEIYHFALLSDSACSAEVEAAKRMQRRRRQTYRQEKAEAKRAQREQCEAVKAAETAAATMARIAAQETRERARAVAAVAKARKRWGTAQPASFGVHGPACSPESAGSPGSSGSPSRFEADLGHSRLTRLDEEQRAVDEQRIAAGRGPALATKQADTALVWTCTAAECATMNSVAWKVCTKCGAIGAGLSSRDDKAVQEDAASPAPINGMFEASRRQLLARNEQEALQQQESSTLSRRQLEAVQPEPGAPNGPVLHLPPAGWTGGWTGDVHQAAAEELGADHLALGGWGDVPAAPAIEWSGDFWDSENGFRDFGGAAPRPAAEGPVQTEGAPMTRLDMVTELAQLVVKSGGTLPANIAGKQMSPGARDFVKKAGKMKTFCTESAEFTFVQTSEMDPMNFTIGLAAGATQHPPPLLTPRGRKERKSPFLSPILACAKIILKLDGLPGFWGYIGASPALDAAGQTEGASLSRVDAVAELVRCCTKARCVLHRCA